MNRPVALALALALVCTAACGSLFQSKAAPPTIYVLSAGATPLAAPAGDSAPQPAIPLDLAILKPRLPTGLATDRIAVLYPDRRLDYFADARWSGPAGDVLQELAIQEFLHSRRHLRTVSGDASVFSSAYWLEIEVTDFQAEYTPASPAPTAHVHFLARIGESGDRRILGRFEADARQPATENRLTAIVDAYARAAQTALAEIAVQADDALGNASAARP
ncbi:MAG TPA: ABC-type transport auxiliary lipoprotein family protein [Steroidobacteraceae bacterium]|nr:ABC-type transport auxiliary lipoprotein family protein [Steroidobacteraceae bacterium]